MEDPKQKRNEMWMRYKCVMCELHFQNEDCVILHMLTHSQICHKCNLCDQTFLITTDLKKHLLTCHVSKEVMTPNAPLQEQNNENLQSFSHKDKKGSISRKGKRHNCPLCNKVFLHKSNLDKHLFSHNQLPPASQHVQMCQSGYSPKDQPNDSSTSVTECFQNIKLEPEDKESIGEQHFECDSKVLDANTDARTEEKNSVEHIPSNHMDSDQFQHEKPEDSKPVIESSTHEDIKGKAGDQVHTCISCPQNFKTKKALKYHLRRAHFADTSFPCSYCWASFTSVPALKRHHEYHCKSIPNANLHPCLLLSCDKVFLSEEQVGLHLRTHDSDEVFNRLKELADDAGKPRFKIYKKVFNSPEEPADQAKKHDGPKGQPMCEDCGRVFTKNSSLKIHRMKAGNCWENLSRFQCPDCPSRFPNQTALRRHRLLYHSVTEKGADVGTNKPIPKTFKCKKCLMVFLEQDTLVNHQQSCSVDLFVCCATCGDKFTEIKALDKHVEDYHCVKPNGEIITSQPVQRHRRICPGEKHYKCGICDKVYDTAKLLRQHIRIHTGEIGEEDRTFICETCGSSFRRESYFKRHKTNANCGDQDRKFYSCRFCDQKFENTRNLKQHKSSNFGLGFTCERCGNRFQRCFDMYRHYKTCGQDIVKNKLISSTCDICGKTFANKANMKIHKILHTGSKPFVCGQCGRRFSFKRSLKRHFAVHSGGPINAYKCSVCGKEISSLIALKTHERRHYRKLSKKHSCAECGQSFTSRSKLRAHEYLHSDKKPLACQYCGKGFIKTEQLRCHLNSHHGVPPEEYPCKFCGRTFSSRFKLTKHLDLDCVSLAATIQQLLPDPSLVASLRDDEATRRVPVGLSEVTDPTLGMEDKVDKPSDGTKSTEIVIQEDDGNGNVLERTIIITIPANVDMAQLLQNDPGIEYADAVDSLPFEEVTQEDIQDGNLIALSVTCHYCGEVCSSREEMDNHLIHHHPSVESSELSKNISVNAELTADTIASSKNTNVISESEGSTSKDHHMCQHCGGQFDSSLDLNDHVLKCERVEVPIPQDPVVKRYSCGICPKGFMTRQSLDEHMLTHPQRKAFPCTLCDKLFANKPALLNHMLDHQPSNLKKFRCHICPKLYSTRRTLKHHMLSHSDEPLPYKCDICSRGFVEKGKVRYHKLQVHKIIN